MTAATHDKLPQKQEWFEVSYWNQNIVCRKVINQLIIEVMVEG